MKPPATKQRRIGLTQTETVQLIDHLRRMLLYQTPHAVFPPTPPTGLRSTADEPLHLLVRLKPASYGEIMRLIAKAGGWTLPPEAKQEALKSHEENARAAFGDGDYDFSALVVGELYAMHEELDGVDLEPDLLRFKEAIAEEIKQRQAEAASPGGEVKT